jgi:hypothetical protein
MAQREGDKYVTAISNASESQKVYPSNTVAKFRIRLPRVLDLLNDIGGSRHEMALVEFHAPISFYNVYGTEYFAEVVMNYPEIRELNDSNDRDGDGEHDYYDGNVHAKRARMMEYNPTVLTLPQGYYDNVGSILHQLNRIDIVSQNLRFKFNNESGRVEAEEQIPGGLRIDLSPKLRELLGFDTTSGEGFIRPGPAPNAVNLFAHVPRQLFVHCDVVEPQLVGDTKRRVLRTVALDDATKFGSLLVKSYDTPHYVPIMSLRFDTIEFDIRTADDKPAPFQFGPSLVKVHIRRKRGGGAAIIL